MDLEVPDGDADGVDAALSIEHWAFSIQHSLSIQHWELCKCLCQAAVGEFCFLLSPSCYFWYVRVLGASSLYEFFPRMDDCVNLCGIWPVCRIGLPIELYSYNTSRLVSNLFRWVAFILLDHSSSFPLIILWRHKFLSFLQSHHRQTYFLAHLHSTAL